ncbi:MAG: CheY-like chemotaxis protein [Patiriisocius sp.]|jgi:CheY-like chemotaxis protein
MEQTKLKKLFVADDDTVFSYLLEFKLEKFKDRILELNFFKNGLELINELKKLSEEETPEIILLDLNMDIMSGLEFLEEFKDLQKLNPTKTKVIILSTSNWTEDRSKALSYDFVIDYFTKSKIEEEQFEKIIEYGTR